VLVELAVGDAYGAGFEYVSPELVRARNDLSGYHAHPRHAIAPGHYTDDTQMSLAVAEALVDGGDWTSLTLASKFVEVFRRDPREGYASGFHGFLSRVTSGEQFLAEIRAGSDKSGAAMRACPVGVLPDLAEVLERTRVQAAITHDTPDGIGAACAAALMPHYFLYRLGPRADLGRFLTAHVPGDWASGARSLLGNRSDSCCDGQEHRRHPRRNDGRFGPVDRSVHPGRCPVADRRILDTGRLRPARSVQPGRLPGADPEHGDRPQSGSQGLDESQPG